MLEIKIRKMHLGRETVFLCLNSIIDTYESAQSPQNANLTTGLENSTYNLISSLDQEAKFLYKTIDTYIKTLEERRDPTWRIYEDNQRRQKETCKNA